MIKVNINQLCYSFTFEATAVASHQMKALNSSWRCETDDAVRVKVKVLRLWWLFHCDVIRYVESMCSFYISFSNGGVSARKRNNSSSSSSSCSYVGVDAAVNFAAVFRKHNNSIVSTECLWNLKLEYTIKSKTTVCRRALCLSFLIEFAFEASLQLCYHNPETR